MSNRAQRRADAALRKRRVQPSSVSTHKKFANTQARLQLLTGRVRRLSLDAADKAEELLDIMASIIHEMASADKTGLDTLGDVARKALDQVMTPKVRDSLRQLKWPDATDETIEEIVLQEVIRRSMIRSDLAITLGFTDRLALIGKDAKLEGRDVEAAMREFYTKTMGSEGSADMRTRLVDMKWRGANADTLEDIVIFGLLDNLDRCVTLATQFSVLEDIDRADPVASTEGFFRRVEEEYHQVLWPNEAAQLMYRITQQQARMHYDEFKDRVVNLNDREIAAFADRINISGEWMAIRPQILKLGWKDASETTIDHMFMDSVMREIRDMARGEGNVTAEVAKRYLARQVGASEGHLRCMEAVIEKLDALERPLPTLIVAVAFEVAGTIRVDPLTRDEATSMAAARADLREALDRSLAQLRDLAIATRPEGTESKETMAAVILTDATGKHITTCCSFTPDDKRLPPPGPPGIESWRDPGAPPAAAQTNADRLLAKLNESHQRCMRAILTFTEALPRPLTPRAIIGFEDDDGVHVVDTDEGIARMTSGDTPFAKRLASMIAEGLNDAVGRHEPIVAVLIDKDRGCTWVGYDHPVEDSLTASNDDAASGNSARWKPARGPTFYASTFDRALMRLGARLWQETYAKGMSDTKLIITFNDKPDVDPVLGRFAAAWAIHAFQRLSTSHTYAAAMMCTDADRESLSTIQQQWNAFSIMVPNGLLRIESTDASDVVFEFTRVLVVIFETHAELNLIDFSGPGGALCMTVGSDAPTLPELLAPDPTKPPTVIGTDSLSRDVMTSAGEQVRRCLTMAKRLVAGLLLSMQNAEAVKTREVARKAGRPGKREEGEPAHRMVIVGQPIKIDCREAVETFIHTGRGSGGKKSGLPQVQWIVRGHWRQQAYGIGRLGRKSIWIKPHWAGRSDAPILSRPKLVT